MKPLAKSVPGRKQSVKSVQMFASVRKPVRLGPDYGESLTDPLLKFVEKKVGLYSVHV